MGQEMTNSTSFKPGKLHPNWKGDKATRKAFHTWLQRNFGKANKCENPKCLGESKCFAWANLNNHKYSHKRKDYKMLCKICHQIMDRRKDYCVNGHELKGDNVYTRPNGRKRECRICRRKQWKDFKEAHNL